MKKYLQIAFALVSYCNMHGQTSSLWDNLHCPLKYYANHLYYDTIQDNLYMAGIDSNSYPAFTYWNGNIWTPMPSPPCSNNYNFINYNGDLLIGSACDSFSIYKWFGGTWLPFTSILPNNGVFCFAEHSNELYVGGVFSNIGSLTVKGVATWNGTTWNNLGSFPYNSTWGLPYVMCLAFYSGELYAAGNFPDNTGAVMNIAKWDGSQWLNVGGGMHGGTDDIADMIVYNGELYIAGAFTKAHGNIGNYIQKWDGTSWNEVGGGVMGLSGGNGQIFDLEVHDNSLYATGSFSIAGGVPVQQIAKWDGTNWCSLGDEISWPTCLAKSSTNLYVGWYGKIIEGDTTGSVIKWIGGTFADSCSNLSIGIHEQASASLFIDIYPTLTTSTITIQFSEATKENTIIEIKNMLGQTMKTLQLQSRTQQLEMDVSGLANGLYFVQCQSKGVLTSKKFVKQ